MARRDVGFRLYPELRLWGDEVRFYLAHYSETGNRQRAVLKFEDVPEGASLGAPTFGLSIADTQDLMDRLWGVGLRPSQGRQSEGVTAAQASHLEDMRAIAFAKLGIERPR